LAAAQAGAALCVVIALVLLTGLLARRTWPGARPPPEPTALRLRASLAVDGRRRLHLIEAPGAAVLVLTGGATDVLLVLPPDRPA
jgi:flagellar biogenesis protein FliO